MRGRGRRDHDDEEHDEDGQDDAVAAQGETDERGGAGERAHGVSGDSAGEAVPSSP